MSDQTNHLLNLFLKLMRSHRFIKAMHVEIFRNKMHRQGSRTGAQGLLIKLWENDGLTNAEIAELLDIKPSSVTAQVKQLEVHGLVERRADEKDGRVSRVFLTEKGKKAQVDRLRQYDAFSEDLFDALTEEEQLELKKLIQKLVDAHREEEWNWDEFAGNPFAGNPFRGNFGLEFKGEMRQAAKEIHRAGHEMKREWHHNFRDVMNSTQNNLKDPEDFGDYGALGDFGNFGFGPIPKGKSNYKEDKSKDEDWSDF